LPGNKLSEIKGFEGLTKLVTLNLHENQISEIRSLEFLDKLTDLDLGRNKIFEIKGLEKLSELVTLNLFGNEISEIRALGSLEKLKELNLGKNYLTEIKGLENLTSLENLMVYDNQIHEITGLEKLIRLNKLVLSSNNIREIKGIEHLTNLNLLGLGGNELIEIKGLESCTQLKSLYLWRNKIRETKGLETLTELTDLDLSENKCEIIEDFTSLSRLTRINLSDNQISEIPKSLLTLDLPIHWNKGNNEDKGIFLENNPFTTPPPEIVMQGNEAIQEYFEQREKSGEELLNEAKLILLGDSRSGKTSLANRLLGRDLPREADRTLGVDIAIGEYMFSLANSKDFKINIWDFAGQDKYKTLHQLFYTDSSVYVMVAESGCNTVDYDDWFQTAALFGEGSPLILVLNEFKSGIGMSSFDSNYWKKQFPELLKEVFVVNLGTKQNLPPLEEFIRLLAQTLPHTKYGFPSNWAAIRRILNGRRNEQYISLKEYLKICAENNLPERESALVLSSVLHKVGDCLHYQKSELLKQFVILKNEWATDAVYKILEDKIVAETKRGFFDMSDLKRIWDTVEYQDMRPQLLELMKQFKLAYQLPGKEEFVTPPLLPSARPESFQWPELDSLELFIEYQFLPRALLTQFIVTRHGDIAEDRTLVWRHGTILKWQDEALAEVSKTKLKGRDAIYIRTQGKDRKGMMTVILKTFRELHSDYKGIKCIEKVPCTCNGCRTKENEQHYFDFANLTFRLEKGRHEVECDKSLETLNVMQMLENSFFFEKFRDGNILQLKENLKNDRYHQIRKFTIFLASSKELSEEREKIEQALGRKKESFRKLGFSVELLIWEDGKHIGKSLRSQDNYNLEIEQCNLFAMIFYSKVGKYSLEEFNLANTLFSSNKKPRILVFQKNLDLPKNLEKADANSRYDFLEHLNKIEHFPTLFENSDKLTNELEVAINKLLDDEDFVKQLTIE
jgi:internalin A